MRIRLSADELTAAAAVGARRRIESIFRRNKPQHYESPRADEWTTEIESAAAEMAFARTIDRYWSGSIFDGNCAKADVGEFGVRHTVYRTGKLIIYEEDDDNDIFVLVVGRAPIYEIAGWMRAGEAKQEKWWNRDARKQSWFVPQSELRAFRPKSKERAGSIPARLPSAGAKGAGFDSR